MTPTLKGARLPSTSGLLLSADVGGTFTDVVLQDGALRWTTKVLTTGARPEDGIVTGIHDILRIAERRLVDVATFVHGTTLATNAIIERRGAEVALIATDGFRDVIEIATESRYDQYELALQRPRPLVPRSRRFTVPERIDARGQVRLPLNDAAVLALVPKLAEAGIESVAIAFLHAYANPAHEQRTAALLREALPQLSISLSSEICPEIREYERTSTTVVNAYVQPLAERYLVRMEQRLREEGFGGLLSLMTSGGGLTSVATARRFPVRLVESGPAGGAIFAGQVAARAGERKVIAFDMGGTTAKVSLIEDFNSQTARVFEVDRAARFLKGSGLPVRIPVIEMIEIGAGGGSLAQVDTLRRITVGPESASSVPGPACYGLGGTRPAVTDADVTLGLIDPAAFAGGSIVLHPEHAVEALEREVGSKSGLTAEMAAYAVFEMVCENMASAVRVHAVERGVVASQHALIAFGGAAPLHVARVAEKVGVRRVIIPPNAGVGAAVGMLAAPVSFEAVRSRYMRLDQFDAAGASALLAAMAEEVRNWVVPAARGAPVLERRLVFMRYVGQGHEITVPLPGRPLHDDDATMLRGNYEVEYARLFARFIPDAPIEVLAWSVTATTEPSLPARVADITPGISQPPPPLGFALVFDGRTGTKLNVPRYQRSQMQPGGLVAGPAIIVEAETSTYVTGSFDAWVDAAGCIVMQRKVVREMPA